MKTFGIGCFHFGITSKMSSPFSVKDYVSEIESTLKAITSISNIDIDFDKTIDNPDVSFTHNGEIPDFSHDKWFPYLNYLDISFEIYIPFRVQTDILKLSEDLLDTQSERFKILIKNCYNSPVSYIIPIDAKDYKCSPSCGVQLVREYLKKEVRKQDGKLQFETLGPSPFHANFFFGIGATINAPRFELSIQKTRAYDNLLFKGIVSHFKNEDTALEKLFDELEIELALFYFITKSRNSYYHAWDQLYSRVEDIMITEKSKGLMGKMAKAFSNGHKINLLVDELCHFQTFLIESNQCIDSDYLDTYAMDGYLKSYIDRILKNLPKFPVNEISELINFREKRNNKLWETVALLMSAILGGVIGSLVTFFLTTTTLQHKGCKNPPQKPSIQNPNHILNSNISEIDIQKEILETKKSKKNKPNNEDASNSDSAVAKPE